MGSESDLANQILIRLFFWWTWWSILYVSTRHYS